MLAVAEDMVDSGAAYGGDVLTVYHDDWSPGLLGIVAGRLSRLHGVPAIAATRDGEGVRASARSVPGLDICAALDGCRELLTEHGGHAQAAGFGTSLTGLSEVHQHLLTVFAGTRRTRLPEVDLELEPDDLGPTLALDMEALSPFGAGNAEPLFGLRDVRPRGLRAFGKQRTHLGFTVPGGRGLDVEVVGWGMADRRDELAAAPSLDISVRALRQQSGSYAPLRLVVEHVYPRPR
jgi:single-stranded-DNA-specific exonuclease